MIKSEVSELLPVSAPAPPDRMQAAVLTGPQALAVQEVPIPQPGPQQVLVRLEGCGVCASNLPVWEGREWFTYPTAPGSPGHEGWGVVEAIGEQVQKVQVGDRVACLSFHAYAPYDLAEENQVLRLPASLEGIPFPGEPLGCAQNIFGRSDVQAGQTVAILGIGFLGALLVQLAKKAGARVIAISQRPSSLELARRCGADETIQMDDHWRIIEEVKQLTGQNFCERVIEATGKEWPLNLAGELTAERGKLIIAGFHQDGLRQVNVQLWNWRGLDVINAHERDPERYLEGMREAILAVESGRLDPSFLYTHHLPQSRLSEAFDLLAQRPDGFVKALIFF
jgi:threonine dehydrogenase-like Zn-dependent dehydrogenase